MAGLINAFFLPDYFVGFVFSLLVPGSEARNSP